MTQRNQRKYAAILFLLAAFSCAFFWTPSRAAEQPVRIGSKAFTESVILGEIARELIVQSGAPAIHRSELGGTRLLWSALLGNEIDLYPEYTGTLTQEILHIPKNSDTATITAALAHQGIGQGIGMTKSLGFTNTYAIGMRRAKAEHLGIRTISDLSHHPELRIGVSNEFRDRSDGWPGLRARYRLPQTDVPGMEHAVALQALRSQELDVTDVYSTDAEIRTDELTTLTDDRHYFPSYDAVFLYRKELERRWPQAVDALRRLEGAISQTRMIELNARARQDHVPEGQIAADFVREKWGEVPTGPNDESPNSGPDSAFLTLWLSIARHLREHLAMVAGSMLPACLVALPLGILAARASATGSRFGFAIPGVLGVIQTIPALALLVLLIQPLKSVGLPGIGNTPATIALFLYSLLPIARNTQAGIRGIDPRLEESADALGLGFWQKLWVIELPLASPTILAGIKTAAVINVGFATLGALVGAGGFGQPILTGIRLNNYGLILQGAIPSAVLALAVQGAFDLVERRLVPRGLRLPQT
jgi:osmoprotectant transport system permease protein